MTVKKTKIQSKKVHEKVVNVSKERSLHSSVVSEGDWSSHSSQEAQNPSLFHLQMIAMMAEGAKHLTRQVAAGVFHPSTCSPAFLWLNSRSPSSSNLPFFLN